MKETKFDATQGIRVFGNDQEIENMLIQLTQDTTIKELSKILGFALITSNLIK